MSESEANVYIITMYWSAFVGGGGWLSAITSRSGIIEGSHNARMDLYQYPTEWDRMRARSPQDTNLFVYDMIVK